MLTIDAVFLIWKSLGFGKISTKYARAYSARKYVQFHGRGSQLAVIREEWGILKRVETWNVAPSRHFENIEKRRNFKPRSPFSAGSVLESQ